MTLNGLWLGNYKRSFYSFIVVEPVNGSMSVALSEISEGDVLEVVFWYPGMDSDVHLAVDVSMVHPEERFRSVRGEVLLVKNMPFDALEQETIKIDCKNDEVRTDQPKSMFDSVLDSNIRLVSV